MDRLSIAAAQQRVEDSLQRKPGLAVHADVPACAVLVGGVRTAVETPDGDLLHTDLPQVIGGDGGGVSPGWLFRAGLASCLVTAVALRAARQGVVLTRLEVRAESESDTRGLLGSAPGVGAAPVGICLHVTVAAPGTDETTLRELVAWADAHSPVGDAVRRAIDVALRVDVQAGPPGA
jgi:organic hydroperoxide reductase OsmC/OhrA